MTLTLARVVDPDGATTPGSRGLSLWYAEVCRDQQGLLQGIELSEEGRGIASIANMLTVTRIHNSVAAAAAMRRVVQLARDYATRRSAFGRLLKDHPLHVQTLARMEETGLASPLDTHILRLLTPVLKLYTAKQVKEP
ncbi:hypothetical protein CRUP_007419 [Coryphaenoides rupestris]|nr:hypothetical protein CRUP_007419 [Coryphaenoides rupestris]